MKAWLFLVSAAVIASSVGGFFAITRYTRPNVMEFETIAKGYYSGYKESADLIVTDENTWSTVWEQAFGNENAPPVNFSTHMIIATFMGEFNTGGYSIRIKEVVEVENRLVVKIEMKYPKAWDVVSMALSQPYHIVKMPKTDKWITFDKTSV